MTNIIDQVASASLRTDLPAF
ncbi:MAG: hypothetical protein JWR55_3226, partial [Aeromicrobium sp.]|nr:hypothetical protein [Aeromicrobium sp.]